jgi:aminopeptidase
MFNLPTDLKQKAEKKKGQFLKIMKNSLGVKKEEILIISDYGTKNNSLAALMAYGYYNACKSKGFNVNLLFQEVKKGFMHTDDHISKALHNLPENNIVIVTSSNKLGRIGDVKSFRTFCKDKKHRFLSATGLGDVKSMHFDIFMDAMCVNYKRMKKQGLAIKKEWDKAKEITIKTQAGTNLVFNVEGSSAVANIGEYHESGSGGNMPAGEVYIPPKGFHGVNGTLVIDGSIKTHHGAKLVDEPVTLFIEHGRIIRMEGKHAKLLEETFKAFEERAKYPERVRHACELGVGINPGAVLIGSTIMDEKVMHTAHVAFGSNYWFGGEIRTIFHGDMVFKNPTFYVDGQKMTI